MKIEINQSQLEHLVDNLFSDQKLEIALGKCCAIIEKEAKELAPKDTGNLRRSITSEVKDKTGIVFTPCEYAPYVEFGTGIFTSGGRKEVPWRYRDDKGQWHTTSGQRPQPFMYPAFDNNEQKILEKFAEVILDD